MYAPEPTFQEVAMLFLSTVAVVGVVMLLCVRGHSECVAMRERHGSSVGLHAAV